MKKGRLIIFCFMVSITLIISGCATEKFTEIPVLEASETAMAETEPTATSVPTATSIPTATSVPTPTPTPEPIVCNVVFDTDRDGNMEIYKTNPDGSETVNLSNNPGDDHAAAYSPDGDMIAFVSNRANPVKEGNFIFVMNADGSGVRQLTHEEHCEDPDWSHDGTMITYSNNGDIYIINADGIEDSINLTNFSPEEDNNPTWSPDGTKIAWLIKNQWGSNAYVMDADGSNVIQVGTNNQSYSVAWTPDGRLFTGWIWEGKDEICYNCISNLDGTNIIHAGGKDEVPNYFPFWLADGERGGLFQTDGLTGNNDIFVVAKSLPDVMGIGIGEINITNNPANDRNPDVPINCGGGWVIDTEAIEKNTQPNEAMSQPTKTANIIIGFTGDDPSQWQRKNNFGKACEELGIQCLYDEIPELLKKDVSAIVLNSSPELIKSTASAIHEAVEKGIPVFVLDAEIDMIGAYSIMADRGDMIRVTLNNLFKESARSGEFAYFDFSPTQMDAELIKGLLVKEYPKVNVVTSDTKTYNIKEEKKYIQDLLSKYPNLKAIWTNAGYTNAVFGIVENISNPAKYPMLNCEANKDGFFIWKDRIAEHPEFECIAVSNPPGIAYDAVFSAYYLATGEKIDESALKGEFGNAFLVDFPVITNENLIKELKIINYEDGGFAVDMLMTPEEIKDKWFQ